jgi:hypothetical protein
MRWLARAITVSLGISDGSSGGRIEGRRLASIDLPAPDGPIIRK